MSGLSVMTAIRMHSWFRNTAAVDPIFCKVLVTEWIVKTDSFWSRARNFMQGTQSDVDFEITTNERASSTHNLHFASDREDVATL